MRHANNSKKISVVIIHSSPSWQLFHRIVNTLLNVYSLLKSYVFLKTGARSDLSLLHSLYIRVVLHINTFYFTSPHALPWISASYFQLTVYFASALGYTIQANHAHIQTLDSSRCLVILVSVHVVCWLLRTKTWAFIPDNFLPITIHI